ncbi:cyanate lyase [Hydrogenobacter thermophilus TK-6]|uniref:Cyanate hydratase n=1 Tax=Hydrogenobacter thermophilus (strain DSM 6534 / IAM 12695 / TK-6) TaxID=608538 RepID=D3DIB8_HYDTT|nr:cyanase [Hydrogenobacter thermophilus]ADO45496.1 cyanate lyase [Hydrogenobacter thermophilus TK-6]BAI69570.1 cyanate lyase [Hydrogenobacter thermophilus TK-6]
MTREEVRDLSLRRKDEKGLTWEELGKAIGKSPIYTAMLLYGYGQATEEEAKTLTSILELPEDAIKALMRAAYRTPSQPWPPTDPFVYRFYEIVLLYMPAIKDVAHELFGDGIMSAIDMSIDLKKVEDPSGTRMLISFNGKWLSYRKF